MNRRHDIDALRVLAFGLLILYHVGMFYVAEWDWHVKSAYQSEWLQLPMLLSNQWRMPLIFLISGLAINFIRHKYSTTQFVARRAWRLLLPLVVGMAFVVPPQAYFEALGKGLVEPGFLAFMARYLTFQQFPEGAWGGVEIATWTWNHLWYLPYLFAYTLVLVPVARLIDGPAAAAKQTFRRMRGATLLLLPVLPLMVYGHFIYPRFPYISHAFFDDWYAHAQYFTFFLYGFLLGRDEGLWAELQAVAAVVYCNRWFWIAAVLGWGHHLLNRPMKWLPYATEAVYPWYILHQTITVIAGVYLSRLSLGPVLEPALVLAATIGGCFALHEYVIRRTPLLRPAFGLAARGRPVQIAAGSCETVGTR
jgi:hypothetical protein